MRVVLVGGVLVVDPGRWLPGRGAHLHPDLGCLAQAERRRAFPRALRVRGPLDADMIRAHITGVATGRSPDKPARPAGAAPDEGGSVQA